MAVPDYVLDATARVLDVVLPLFKRTPGATFDATTYAAYRRTLARLAGDTRAAARSTTLAADLAAVVDGYRSSSSDVPAVLDGLDRVINAVRAWQPVTARSDTLALQRAAEIGLCSLIESLAVAAQAIAVAGMTLASHDQAATLRARLARTMDTAIDRASEQRAFDVLRALRALQAKVTRDLIERGRPLARITTYETGLPLPAVVLAWLLYQDAGRAAELRAENPGTDHPSFMPTRGKALSR